MKLVIAGGGTGGHLFPGIAIAEEFLSRSPDNEVLFIGSERGIEAREIPKLGYPLRLISAAGIRGKGTFAKITGALQLLYGYAESRKILKAYAPDLVVGVGGYASLPVVLAARGLDIPRFIHEQNAIPGKANKLLAQVSAQVFISLHEAQKYFPANKTVCTGNPLRQQILTALNGLGTQENVSHDASSPHCRIFIFGGSQGARTLNTMLPVTLAGLPDSLKSRLFVVHQTGAQDEEAVREQYMAAGLTAEVKAFIDDMASQYTKADLVICRAGATTIAEITAMGKACLFIPFPFATDDHQRKNAEALLKSDACEMVLEQEIKQGLLAERLTALLANPDRLKELGHNARELGQTNAAHTIVDLMLKDISCTEK
ncbi:MAG: undecaprenyldiphospho-muramoylpentapeptide beta-N-acetylglucosaminyltransferase [Trichlorobacter sp.]